MLLHMHHKFQNGRLEGFGHFSGMLLYLRITFAKSLKLAVSIEEIADLLTRSLPFGSIT